MSSANAAVYISWGTPVAGREMKGLELFMQVTEYYAKLKAENKIVDHHIYLATNGSLDDASGFMTIEGDMEQLRKVLDSDEYKAQILKAQHLVGAVRIVHCISGAEIPKFIEKLVKVRKELGIA